MDKNELFNRLIGMFAESTSHMTKDERRNVVDNILWANYRHTTGFNEQLCDEITNGIIELVEKELQPVEFEGTIASNNSTGTGIRYTMPNSAKDGFIYVPKTDKFNIGDKCIITVKKI